MPANEEGTYSEVETAAPEHIVSATLETPSVETEVSEDSSEKFDKAYVEKLRKEAAAHRVEKQQEKQRNEELLAKLQEYEDAKLSTEERMAKEFEETKSRANVFEQKARDLELNYQLAMAAKDEHIVDVKAAVKLADRELISYDDNGNISNLSDVLESLRTEYPALFNKGGVNAPNTGATNPAKSPSAKKYTREDLKNLSPEKRLELMESGAFNHLLGRK